jgi:PAS domain S-box-containing protein
MNPVWSLLAEAGDLTSLLAQVSEQEQLVVAITDFRATILDTYKAREIPPELQKPTLREEYAAGFNGVISLVDQMEVALDKQIDERMKKFKVLYVALIANFFLLFCFTIFSFWRYSTHRRRTENQLRNMQENLNTIINSIDSMLITIDASEAITQWNTAAEKYFGHPSQNVLGTNVFEAVPILAAYRSKIETVFHSNKSRTMYREACGKPGQERFYNIAFGYCGAINGVVIRIDDVTKQELVDEQMRQSQKMEVVENLVGGLANDFNNVLGAIMGTISMLKFSLDNPERAIDDIRANIDVIESSTERAVVMVGQLLSISQKAPSEFAPIDLNASVRHILKICQNTFDKRIELIAELFDVKSLVKGDAAQLEQVFLNMCDNAAQAMTTMRAEGEDQGGQLLVSIDKVYPDKNYRANHPKATESAYWILRFTDSGIGMSAETLAKIFDPFFTTKKRGESTGLGLTMVNDIIQTHGGFIEVESEQGKGTTFHIFLPEYVAKTRGGEEEEQEVKVDEEEKIPVGTGNIFVVDDEVIMRKTASGILKKLGYDVLTAENGEEAVEIFKEKHAEIRLTILDMAMPKKSGKEAYIEMKKIDPNLKVLLVSGFTKDKRIDEVLALGVNGFIKKPYSMVTLAQEIKKTLQG